MPTWKNGILISPRLPGCRDRPRATLQCVGATTGVAYPIPDNQAERQAALDEQHILDTESDEDFTRITRLASQMLGVPTALISMVDRQRQ